MHEDDDRNGLKRIIEELSNSDIKQCAVILLNKSGDLTIGSYNIDEVDMITLFRQTANYMVDEGEVNLGKTFH